MAAENQETILQRPSFYVVKVYAREQGDYAVDDEPIWNSVEGDHAIETLEEAMRVASDEIWFADDPNCIVVEDREGEAVIAYSRSSGWSSPAEIGRDASSLLEKLNEDWARLTPKHTGRDMATLEDKIRDLEEQLASQAAHHDAESMKYEKILSERNKEIESLRERLDSAGLTARADGTAITRDFGDLSLKDMDKRYEKSAQGEWSVSYEAEAGGAKVEISPIEGADGTGRWSWVMEAGRARFVNSSPTLERALESAKEAYATYVRPVGTTQHKAAGLFPGPGSFQIEKNRAYAGDTSVRMKCSFRSSDGARGCDVELTEVMPSAWMSCVTEGAVAVESQDAGLNAMSAEAGDVRMHSTLAEAYGHAYEFLAARWDIQGIAPMQMGEEPRTIAEVKGQLEEAFALCDPNKTMAENLREEMARNPHVWAAVQMPAVGRR